jgi:hypothetical protein
MPKDRINRRENNLARVSDDKAEADVQQTSGLFYMFSYYDKKTRREHKVSLDENGQWLYEIDNKPVPNGQYMYAVGKNGALYIGTPTVHSQFKAGKETQSAGWIDYNWDKHNIVIDNCSGHYTPTLSQFLSTLYGLHTAKVLPDHFQLKLSKFTAIDYDTNKPFWQDVINDSKGKHEETDLLKVEFSAKLDGFVFSRGNGVSVTMSRQEIFKNIDENHSFKMK